ncbi:MAG: DUF669 domain-containing protein [Clostridium sp.]|jgi:hypothetical protein|nr:DUF669 domain-containing protein [Clostridium sp.]
MDQINRELQWDDEIKEESPSFLLLTPGDYDFTVESFERSRHPGSAKLPACNKAVLKIVIKTQNGTATINHNLFLHTITEGFLSAFFSSIGQKKKNEPLKMNWSQVPGSTGRCKVGTHKYKAQNGEEQESNEILRFYPKAESQTTSTTQTPKFKAGEF